MKIVKTMVLLATLAAFGAMEAEAAGFGSGSTSKPLSASVKKSGRKTPKKPKYTKLRAAVEAATEWEQPIVMFVLKDGDEASTQLKQKVLNRAELAKGFWTTNCVLCVVTPPISPRDRNRFDEEKMDKDLAKFLDTAQSKILGLKVPYVIVADSKGIPVGKASDYVIDVGVGPWISSLEAVFSEQKFPFHQTKESQKLVTESKPDGRSRKR